MSVVRRNHHLKHRETWIYVCCEAESSPETERDMDMCLLWGWIITWNRERHRHMSVVRLNHPLKFTLNLQLCKCTLSSRVGIKLNQIFTNFIWKDMIISILHAFFKKKFENCLFHFSSIQINFAMKIYADILKYIYVIKNKIQKWQKNACYLFTSCDGVFVYLSHPKKNCKNT